MAATSSFGATLKPPQSVLANHTVGATAFNAQIKGEPGQDLYHTEHVVDLNKVSIRYGERTILKDLDWTVKSGEKWALSGENGSGKSTLLSLVCADNPQSYACLLYTSRCV